MDHTKLFHGLDHFGKGDTVVKLTSDGGVDDKLSGSLGVVTQKDSMFTTVDYGDAIHVEYTANLELYTEEYHHKLVSVHQHDSRCRRYTGGLK